MNRKLLAEAQLFDSRYVTMRDGSDDVAYFTTVSINALLTKTFGHEAVRKSGFVRPWRNNLAAPVRQQQTSSVGYDQPVNPN